MNFYNFEDEYELAENILRLTEKNISTSIISSYDDIEMILKAIISIGEFNLYSIDLTNPEFNGYDNCYVMSFDEENNIYVQKMFINNKFISVEDDVLFVEESVDDKTLCNCSYNKLNKFTIDIPFACDCNCCYDNEDSMHGFTMNGTCGNTTWQKSFYSSDKDLVNKMIEKWS